MIHSGLVGPTDFSLWEGCRESRRCSRDTYPESYITKYTSTRGILVYKDNALVELSNGVGRDETVCVPDMERDMSVNTATPSTLSASNAENSIPAMKVHGSDFV